MSLPIVRLRNVDLNASTIADDLVSASCTLYSFLDPVPTRAEYQVAMEAFRCALHRKMSSRLLPKSNVRMLNLLNASVHDGVLRYPPKVVPGIARNSQAWRTFLKGKGTDTTPAGGVSPKRETRCGGSFGSVTRAECGNVKLSPSTQTKALPDTSGGLRSGGRDKWGGDAASWEEPEVVRDRVSMHQMRFPNPYEPMNPPAGGQLITCDMSTGTETDVSTESVSETERRFSEGDSYTIDGPPDTIMESTQVWKGADAGSDCRKGGKKKVPTGSGGRGKKKGRECHLEASDEEVEMTDEVHDTDTDLSQVPHPILCELLNQVESTLPAEEDKNDVKEWEFGALMESKAASIRERLEHAFASISPAEKETAALLQELEGRVAMAEKLLQVEKHEEETIQIAHCTLIMEIEAMRRTLKEVMHAVREAEVRHAREGSQSPFYMDESRLMVMLQQALSSAENQEHR
uniref:Uncharacterized protein TCIL3000_11_16420 n=1 Tax=Trypanosoma congolense (strain IL3000) TaxID=1068625 RepID=G0V3A7_TRYCI|nr:unnamed protein product [Trypanosoma congolense IL3000]